MKRISNNAFAFRSCSFERYSTQQSCWTSASCWTCSNPQTVAFGWLFKIYPALWCTLQYYSLSDNLVAIAKFQTSSLHRSHLCQNRRTLFSRTLLLQLICSEVGIICDSNCVKSLRQWVCNEMTKSKMNSIGILNSNGTKESFHCIHESFSLLLKNTLFLPVDQVARKSISILSFFFLIWGLDVVIYLMTSHNPCWVTRYLSIFSRRRTVTSTVRTSPEVIISQTVCNKCSCVITARYAC